MGGAVLAPQGLHAGLHDGARLHGPDQAGVRPQERQDRRPLRRYDQRPRGVGEGHRGDAGRGAQLSDYRGRRFQRLKDLRHAARGDVGRPEGAHAGRQPDGAERLRDRPGQEDQAHPRLSDDDRPQLRRGPARDRLAAAHGRPQGLDARQLEAGRGRHHRRLGLERRGEGALRQWEEPKPYIRIVPQPS